MYKDKIVLNEVNSINKIICYILFIATMIFTVSPWFLLIFSLIFLFLTEEYKYLNILSLVSVVIGLITILFPPLLWINKLLCLVLYTCFIIKFIRLEQVKYIVELLTYQFQSNKITFILISIIYRIRLLKKNYRLMDQKRRSYALKKDSRFIIMMLKESFITSSKDVKEIMMIHKLRFYNLYQTRTYSNKPTWERWDTDYLIIHFITLVMAVIIGR